MRTLDVLLGVGVLLLCAPRAAAEVRLDWQAAEGCPDAATVKSAMNHWLVTTGAPLTAAEVQIAAEVERSTTGYELALELRTRAGARRMRMFSESCEVFSQVIAVQASLLIASDEAEPPQAAAVVPEPAPKSVAAESWLALRAQGLLVSSPLPAPTFGLSIAAAYVMLPLRVELAVGYLFGRALRYDAFPSAGGDLQSGFVSLRPCAALQLWRVELSGCAGAQAALMRGEGVGVSGARTTVRRWFAVVLGAGLHMLLTPTWSVWLGVDLLTSLTRPEFYVAELGLLHRPERLGVQSAVGIEMRVW